jgi:hypothetical protein
VSLRHLGRLVPVGVMRGVFDLDRAAHGAVAAAIHEGLFR